jgi:radical SAM superfamily enzyme YgiQ (UPF0313 family)
MPRFGSAGDGYAFPLGMAYISAVMKREKYNVFIVNLNHIEVEVKSFLKEIIESSDINVVMTGGLSGNFVSLKEIVSFIKLNYPEIVIIVGGGIITADPEVSMQAFEDVDIGVIGEAELTIVELCNTLENKGRLDNIRGIIYQDRNSYIVTPQREEITDLDSLPFPDYEGFGLQDYLNLPPPSINQEIKPRTAFIVGSRGCTNYCTFCFHPTGRKYRQRSIENIFEEINYLKEKYNVKHIRLSDELFATDKVRVKSFADRMKELNMTWLAFFRLDFVDEELVSIIKNSTCSSMNFGIESADDGVLKSMRKNLTVWQIEKALFLVSQAGITFSGNLIFGDIAETFQSANKTLDWWENHREYNLTLRFIVTYPGSYLYRYALSKGIIKNPVQFLKNGCPQINLSKLSTDELSIIAKRLIKIYDNGIKIEDATALVVDNTGRMSLSGKCPKCGTPGEWENIKLFANNNWCRCKGCNVRFVIDLPSNLKSVFIFNVKKIISECQKKNKKIAFWGITSRTLGLFENEKIFEDDTIMFIDTSNAKQLIRINNKTVFSPKILEEIDVSIVVCCYPNRIETVRRLCNSYVEKVIHIYRLLHK